MEKKIFQILNSGFIVDLTSSLSHNANWDATSGCEIGCAPVRCNYEKNQT